MNNDILGTREAICNNVHEWRSHEWKPLPNVITSDPKIVIHSNECIIFFCMLFYVLNTQFR